MFSQHMKGNIILGLIMGIFVTLCFVFISVSAVVSTSKVRFCVSCHEMRPFYNTWKNGVHGTYKMGAIKAKCVDCHLPHKSITGYLVAKAMFGLNDFWAHNFKKTETLPLTWIKEWEGIKPKAHKGYESGCKECHKELIAPGIPIKAFTAHRAYLLGETNKTCISCHHMVGHGDILTYMRNKLREQKNKAL